MTTIKALKFQIENNIIYSYKRLPYTAWHAIAEFVDNSTQSFFNNRKALEDANKKSKLPRPLKISVEYEAAKDLFRITDNAMGMSFDELSDALCVSKPPLIASGRSQFGMGMKTASAWIGNRWTITTKKLGESQEYSVEIDVDQIASGKDDLKYTVNDGSDKDSHYTIITINNHNQKFHGRSLGKISQYLRSMYRQDFRDKILTLIWREEELNWEEVDQRLAIDKSGKPYSRDFKFTVGTDSDNPKDIKDKEVKGWLGILAKGKRRDAGLTIFHSNRVIRGWPDTYRPEAIYGDERNDLLNQRLLGEIHLDGFLVSHTKDAIQWMGDQEEQVENELLGLFSDYIRFANEPKSGKEDSRGPSYQEKEMAVQDLETELKSSELADLFNLEPLPSQEMITLASKTVIENVSNNASPRFTVVIGEITVYLYLQPDLSINDKYLTVEASQDNEVLIIVNENHPHWHQIRGAEGVLNFLRHCVYDGIAEWKARKKQGTIDPDTIKVFKDGYLRLPMEIEKHQS